MEADGRPSRSSPGRAPVDVVVGAVDAALRSGLAGLVVGVALPADDERRAPLERLTAADARVTIAAPGTSRPARTWCS